MTAAPGGDAPEGAPNAPPAGAPGAPPGGTPQAPTDGAPRFPGDWAACAPGAARLAGQIDAQIAEPVLPPPQRRYRALAECAPDAVRVLVLGQDPYHTPGVADGLAFSCADGRAAPSLRNILREMADDLGLGRPPAATTLDGWARQGVLLLNTALSVPPGQPNAHAALWAPFTQTLLHEWLARRTRPPVAIAWGSHAQKMLAPFGLPMVASVHPSPLSAKRGFFGSRPFSRVNALLAEQGQPPVDWTRMA